VGTTACCVGTSKYCNTTTSS